MPQLPSGKYVGIQCSSPEAIFKKIGDNVPMANIFELCRTIERINTVEALMPYVWIILVRDTTGPTDDQNLSPVSLAVPEDKETYRSEFTLSDLGQLTADWPNDDTEAFREFLASERAQSYLHECLSLVAEFSKQNAQNLFQFISTEMGRVDDMYADNGKP